MSEPLPEGRFVGREAFRDLVFRAVEAAREQDWPEMVWSDPDFEDWPLAEPALVDGLQAWVRDGHGRLRLLASDFRTVQARDARFVRWRRDNDHRLEARSSGRHRAAETPSAIWSPAWCLVKHPSPQGVLVATTDPTRRAQLRQSLESLWQQSVPGFPATTLGL